MIERLCILLLAIFAISCGGASRWAELDAMEDWKEAFNRDSGKARIVLLLSPT